MARMIPAVPVNNIAHDSEALVYAALEGGLSKKYTVFHSYPWLRLWRGDEGRALLEGEADFVVVHPERGLLVLEVKGGKVHHEDGRWHRRVRDSLKPIRDPFEQARRNMHALLSIIKEYSGGALGRDDLAHGYAVWFPHLDYNGTLPANTHADIVLTQRHLDDPGPAVRAALSRWTAEPRPLSPRLHDRLIKALTPDLAFFRPLGPDLQADGERIALLTDVQAQVAEGLLASPRRALVRGCAGSGKTELAVRSALRLAQDGARVLLVCYNRHLAAWLGGRTRANDTGQGSLEVTTFHSLARELARTAQVPWESTRTGRELDARFWEEEAHEIMSQAALVLENTGRAPRYDAIVIDEGQDFRPMWWLGLEEDLLTDDGTLHAFMDPDQSLWDTGDEVPLSFDLTLTLDTNCRNTKRVASFSASVADVTARVLDRAPEGLEVKVTKVQRQEDQLDAVRQRVKDLLGRGLLPAQLALLGPTALERGSLATTTALDGVPFTTSPSDWRAGAGILVSTARAFKGLEASAVILYDVGGLSKYFTRTDLYVACTRAVSVLEVITHGDDLSQTLRTAMEKIN